MRIMIVYGRELDVNVHQLVVASKKLGNETISTSIMNLSASVGPHGSGFWIKNRELSYVDVCFLRSLGPGKHEQITRRLSLIEHLEQAGTHVINSPRAFRIARDKYATYCALTNVGIKVPKTFVTENATLAYNVSKRFGVIVCKPMIGSMGYGSMKFDNPDLAYNAFRLLERIGQPIYIQEYLPKPGRDIRAFVLGGRVLASIYRTAPPGEWKTNIAQGGCMEAVDLPSEIEALALKVARTLGLEYAGIDIAETAQGPVVLEVNSSPGWQGLQKATNVNVAEHLIRYAMQEAKN
ncbi:RimK family alpha-L-glutamate ligase [Candidatus Bathyarchaeota archaeon]|nr:RimK family alpha-L-glutamate ligase [Candidatus Bathyarchaeota archaeon]